MKLPGKDLDVEVAKKILHYIIIIDSTGNAYTANAGVGGKRDIENFSTDTNDAYLLIRFLANKGYMCNVKSEIGTNGELHWFAAFFTSSTQPLDFIYSKGISLPHSVCLSALRLIDGLE